MHADKMKHYFGNERKPAGSLADINNTLFNDRATRGKLLEGKLKNLFFRIQDPKAVKKELIGQ